MTTRTRRRLREDDIERLARKAEDGFDLANWSPRRGRPPLDREAAGHAPRVAARVPRATYDRALRRASSEGRTISDVVRSLLETYAAEPPKG